ncbi:MAG: transcription-repair coupling factor, partial [Clostridia bacterium]|nr:transcription-repair coupling factor [Clostridia bacterium]
MLSGILSGAFDAVITTPDAMLGYTIPTERLLDATMTLDFDTRIDPEDLAHRLIAAGYARVDMVDGAGQFARRGGIVDIYPPMGTFVDEDGKTVEGSYPLRIELFDDEIDRMVFFDIDSQRTVASISSVTLPPAREILCDAKARATLAKAVKDKLRNCRNDDARAILSAELAALGTGTGDAAADLHFIDKYISLIYPEKQSLTDYLDRKPLILIRSTSAVHDRLKAAVWQSNQNVTELVESGTIAGAYAEYQKSQAEFEHFLDTGVTVHVDSLSYGMSGKRLGGIFGFRTRHMVSYAENFQLLCEDLTGYMRGGYRTAVMAENETAANNLAEMLSEHGFDAVIDSAKHPISAAQLKKDEVTIVWRSFLFGYELITPRIALLSTNPDGKTATLSVQSKPARKKKQREGTAAILSYADLCEGDYVVHETHGIGIYTGIETLSISGAKRDYIGIKYAGADKLYIPVEKLDMVSKYIGARAEDGTVKLSKFGTDSWQKSKARAKAAVKDMAKELIQLYAQRMRVKGHAFPPDEDFQRDFEAAFAYNETDSQLDAAEDIKRDMEKPVPMDRLLCGDVGYGKTEVAFRAAYKAILGGKQVALLVPTTILALQHFQTATARMRAFGVNIDMVSRFRTPKQQ